MKTSLTLLATVWVALVGAAHASEVSDAPRAQSMLSRADVRADAGRAATVPGELYDGAQRTKATATPAALSRDDVRMQARTRHARSDDYTGG